MARGRDNRALAVPQLRPETAEEKRLYAKGKVAQEARKQVRERDVT